MGKQRETRESQWGGMEGGVLVKAEENAVEERRKGRKRREGREEGGGLMGTKMPGKGKDGVNGR